MGKYTANALRTDGAKGATAAVPAALHFIVPHPDLLVLLRRSSVSLVLASAAACLFAACTVSEHAANSTIGEGGSAGGTDSAKASSMRLDSASLSVRPSSGALAAPADTTAQPAARVAPRLDLDKEFPIVRALYVNRWAAQSTKTMARADPDRRRDGDQRARHRHEGRVRAELQAAKRRVREERRQRRATVPNLTALLDTLQGAQHPADRAHRGVQGFGDGARAPAVDDPEAGRLGRGATRRGSRG